MKLVNPYESASDIESEDYKRGFSDRGRQASAMTRNTRSPLTAKTEPFQPEHSAMRARC